MMGPLPAIRKEKNRVLLRKYFLFFLSRCSIFSLFMSVLLSYGPAQAIGTNAIEVGGGADIGDATATADGNASIAIGRNVSATNTESIALGAGATASGVKSLALGTSTNSTANRSVAIGDAASATSAYSLAIGANAAANSGENALAIGLNAIGSGAEGIAIGYTAAATSTSAIALGQDAHASGISTISIGQEATASATGSVALGRESVASSNYTVSVGSGLSADAATHQYRRIVNVATPVDEHDAVTKGYVDSYINSHANEINTLKRRVDNVGAMQMSVANAQVPIPEGRHTAIGVGVGSYNGTQATTLGFAHRLPGNFQLSGNFTLGNGGEKAGGMGVGYTF